MTTATEDGDSPLVGSVLPVLVTARDRVETSEGSRNEEGSDVEKKIIKEERMEEEKEPKKEWYNEEMEDKDTDGGKADTDGDKADTDGADDVETETKLKIIPYPNI